MENTKNPLPEEMDHIDGNRRDNNDSADSQDNQLVDLDNPMLHTIDNDDVIDNSAGFDNSEVGSAATQGLTPILVKRMGSNCLIILKLLFTLALLVRNFVKTKRLVEAYQQLT